MKKILTILILGLLLFIAACDPSSLNVLFEDQHTAFEPEILDSITTPFDGFKIFTGTTHQSSSDRHRLNGFDLSYNERYQAFNHTIFNVDEISDSDIIYWAITNLTHRQEGEFAVLNLNNNNQLVVMVQPNTYNLFSAVYRSQESNATNQQSIDWWDIATVNFTADADYLPWNGFVKNTNDTYVIRRISSPFR